MRRRLPRAALKPYSSIVVICSFNCERSSFSLNAFAPRNSMFARVRDLLLLFRRRLFRLLLLDLLGTIDRAVCAEHALPRACRRRRKAESKRGASYRNRITYLPCRENRRATPMSPMRTNFSLTLKRAVAVCWPVLRIDLADVHMQPVENRIALRSPAPFLKTLR